MLHNALLILFPDYKYGDWALQDDGDGPYIKKWNRAEQEPTATEINAAVAKAATKSARDLKITETKAEAKRRIIAQFPGASLENYRDKELIALMRSSRLLKKKEAGTITVAEQAKLDALDATAAKVEAIITASDEIEADIAASADPANFDVVNSPRWPA